MISKYGVDISLIQCKCPVIRVFRTDWIECSHAYHILKAQKRSDYYRSVCPRAYGRPQYPVSAGLDGKISLALSERRRKPVFLSYKASVFCDLSRNVFKFRHFFFLSSIIIFKRTKLFCPVVRLIPYRIIGPQRKYLIRVVSVHPEKISALYGVEIRSLLKCGNAV